MKSYVTEKDRELLKGAMKIARQLDEVNIAYFCFEDGSSEWKFYQDCAKKAFVTVTLYSAPISIKEYLWKYFSNDYEDIDYVDDDDENTFTKYFKSL